MAPRDTREFPLIYFAHPITDYSNEYYESDIETQAIHMIETMLPYKVLNPNQPIHAQNYNKAKKEKGNGMLYFLGEVLPLCHAGILMPFKENHLGSGLFGAGVHKEGAYFLRHNLPLYEITRDLDIIKLEKIPEHRKLNVEQTRAVLKELTTLVTMS
ncbi:MAG: hypothetical protein ACMXYK_02125 [Candidatus Woesearchaeota archaeon]